MPVTKINYLFAQKNLRAETSPKRRTQHRHARSKLIAPVEWLIPGHEPFQEKKSGRSVCSILNWLFRSSVNELSNRLSGGDGTDCSEASWRELLLLGLRCRRPRNMTHRVSREKLFLRQLFFVIFAKRRDDFVGDWTYDCTNLGQSTSLWCFDSNYKSNTQQGTTDAS